MLLVLIALVSVGQSLFVAYHRHWIHQRHELLERDRARLAATSQESQRWLWREYAMLPQFKDPPGCLGLFHEKGMASVHLTLTVDSPKEVPQEVELARRLFPEAAVTWTSIDKNGNFFPADQGP